MKAMPKPVKERNPELVHYGGGVVYTSQKAQKFRCLRVRGDVHSECRKRWGGQGTGKEAWKECIDEIEAHNLKESRTST